jgi:hypothetical protein
VVSQKLLPVTCHGLTRYSASTNHKIWAAKFTARHPNLVAMEISNFKCGHDAPIYGVIEGIIEKSHTPYFCFKDLDENKPTGSVKIRVETIDYFLRCYRDDIIRRVHAEREIEARLAEYEREPPAQPERGVPGKCRAAGRTDPDRGRLLTSRRRLHLAQCRHQRPTRRRRHRVRSHPHIRDRHRQLHFAQRFLEAVAKSRRHYAAPAQHQRDRPV